MLFSHPAVEAITWWDFSDFRAWKGAPAGFLREDMSPKPAYDALMKLIRDTWWTETTLQSDADGSARFRGFLGAYRVTVRAPGREPIDEQFQLTKSGENRWEVRLR
jgi:hypothetical protein